MRNVQVLTSRFRVGGQWVEDQPPELAIVRLNGLPYRTAEVCRLALGTGNGDAFSAAEIAAIFRMDRSDVEQILKSHLPESEVIQSGQAIFDEAGYGEDE